MSTVSVRYFVNDVDATVDFYTKYTKHLGFTVAMRPAASFAILARDDLRLFLNAADGPGGATQPMPDGASLSLAAGTASSSRSRISNARSRRSAKPGQHSAMTS